MAEERERTNPSKRDRNISARSLALLFVLPVLLRVYPVNRTPGTCRRNMASDTPYFTCPRQGFGANINEQPWNQNARRSTASQLGVVVAVARRLPPYTLI